MKKKKRKNSNYQKKEKILCVVGKAYGDGIIPDLESAYHVQAHCSCISSSGGSICGGFRGAKELPGEPKLFFVECAANMQHCLDLNEVDFDNLGDL